MKLKICFLLCLCPSFWVSAQDITINRVNDLSAKRSGLEIGSAVPDVLLKIIAATPMSDGAVRVKTAKDLVHMDTYKGKLLIVDFWATSCGSCITAMPRLDSLQKEFADRVVILPATAEGADRINAFLKANKYLKRLNIKTVVEDRDLHALFPHRLLPHEVWISPSGKVLGFTDVKDVTATSILDALVGENFVVAEKKDVLDYDAAKPLLVGNNGAPDTAYRYRSVITPEIKGLPSAISIRYDSLKNLSVIRATNMPVKRLYAMVYPMLRSLPEASVLLSAVRGLWCYELTMPGRSPSRVRQSVKEDLDRFFNVSSEWTGTMFKLLPALKDAEPEPPLTL